MEKKVRELIQKVSKNKDQEYVILTRNFDFLMKERVKLIENQMKQMVGLNYEEQDKAKIIASVREINKVAAANGSDLVISEDYDEIEALLRISLIDDIASEFKKQSV